MFRESRREPALRLAKPAPRAHLAPMTDLSRLTATPPSPRAYPGINWIGVKTLYLREVRRFM